MNYDTRSHNVVNFCLSKDLKVPFQFKITSIDGYTRPLSPFYHLEKTLDPTSAISVLMASKFKQSSFHDVFVSCYIVSSGNSLTVPVITSSEFFLDWGVDNLETKASIRGSSSSSTLAFSSSALFESVKTNAPIANKITRSKWLSLPINYHQLPLNSKLKLKLYNYDLKTGRKVFIGESETDLFNFDNKGTNNCTLKKGHHKLKINLTNIDNESDENGDEILDSENKLNLKGGFKDKTVMERLEEKLKSRESDDIVSIDWLDQMTFRRIEQINLEDMARQREETKTKRKGGNCYIHVEFTNFDVPVVFSDSKYATLNVLNSETFQQNGDTPYSVADQRSNDVILRGTMPTSAANRPPVFDPDQYRSEASEDPIEFKFRKLERTHQTSPLDRDIKPTLRVRSDIQNILKKQFFEKLTQKEKNLLWKFRFFLLNSLVLNTSSPHFNNFVINFIKCIDWDDDFEVNEFLTIINDLDVQQRHRDTGRLASDTNADLNLPNIFIRELEIVDCLELLGAQYKNHILRNMAVERLKIASDESLEMYFVQLVSTIKHEADYVDPHSDVDDDNDGDISDIYDLADSTMTNASSDYQIIETQGEDPILNLIHNPKLQNLKGTEQLKKKLPKLASPVANLLIERAISNTRLTNYLYWHLKVEVDDERALSEMQYQDGESSMNETAGINTENMSTIEQDQFLQTEAVDGKTVSNNNAGNTHPSNDFTSVRNKRSRRQTIFQKTMVHFIIQLASSDNGRSKITSLRNQIDIVSRIHDISLSIKKEYKKETTPRKIEILKELLVEKKKSKPKMHTGSLTQRVHSGSGDYSSTNSLAEFEPVYLPLDPSVEVCGSIPEESSVFKSSLTPLKITFKTTSGERYPVMYKIGDDLRQDQFVTQILTLMEKILMNENLDLKLRPYKIIATGSEEGFLQFVPNSSLSSILKKHNNSILTYLQIHNPDQDAPHKVKPEVMDNYVRSCAGYCVVTYLLGVGDRHLENLLLTKDGYFFHVDYGYILGQDPKPFPPLMKLPIQIIEGMGGLEDDNYKKFCNYCFISYITLRKNANLILNLFQLMIDSSIPVLRTSASLNGGSRVSSNEIEKLELIWKIQEKFMLELTDEEAVLHFQNLINDSVNAFLPLVIDRLHSLAQYWRA